MDNKEMRSYMGALKGRRIAASFTLPGMTGTGTIELPNGAGAGEILDALETKGAMWAGVAAGYRPGEASEWLMGNIAAKSSCQ